MSVAPRRFDHSAFRLKPATFLVAWTALACAVQSYLWLGRPAGVPRNLPRGQTVSLPRDGGDARLSQTFRVEADGLESITLYPIAGAGRAAASTARADITLSDVTDETRPLVVHRATLAARDAAVSPGYTLSMPTVARSAGHRFELAIDIVGATAATPLQFMSVADNVYGEGVLRVNGNPEWGDLAFSARASQDTPFREFLSRARPAGWPRSAVFWLGVLACYDAGCAVLFWTLIAPPRRSTAPAI
jgi:hypothetical protein